MIDPSTLQHQRSVFLDLEGAIRKAARDYASREEAEIRASVPLCPICSRPVEKGLNGRWRTVCVACGREGYVAMHCEGCGGPLKRTDQKGPKGIRRNRCRACRLEMEEDEEPKRAASRRTMRLIHLRRGYNVPPEKEP